jgi:hypothetical protein
MMLMMMMRVSFFLYYIRLVRWLILLLLCFFHFTPQIHPSSFWPTTSGNQPGLPSATNSSKTRPKITPGQKTRPRLRLFFQSTSNHNKLLSSFVVFLRGEALETIVSIFPVYGHTLYYRLSFCHSTVAVHKSIFDESTYLW